MLYNILKDLFWGSLRLLFRRLTKEEKDILEHCAERGEIWRLHAEMFGDWVRSGTHNFSNQDDLGYNAIYNDALDRLCGRGLVKHDGGDLYRLTGTGFKIARDLLPTNIKEDNSNEKESS